MVSKSADPLTRDRGFESGSLQRRVTCELYFLSVRTLARVYFTVAEVARRGDPADRNHPEFGGMSEREGQTIRLPQIGGRHYTHYKRTATAPSQFGSSSLTERST